MLVRPIARWVNRSRVERLSILLTCLVLVVSERAGAQSCYQFSNAHDGAPATVTATFPLTTIPASLVPPGQGDVDYTAAFSSAPGLQSTRVSYSPTHIATIIERGQSHTFNMFTVTIRREGTLRRLQFDGANYPPADPENTFSVFIRQAESTSADPFRKD